MCAFYRLSKLWYQQKKIKIHGNLIVILKLYWPLISSSLLTLSVVLLYLDDWKLSKNKIIKSLQILTFISIPLTILILSYYNVSFLDVIIYINDNKDINLHGYVTVDKEAGKAIGQGLNTIGSQIGLGATMIGVSAAVSKAIAKSGMPPLQKVGLIVDASIIGGIGHSTISAANRDYVRMENVTSITQNPNISFHINKLIDDNDYYVSPLQELLSNGEIMNYTCLGLVYILIIQLAFKLYFKENINLNLNKLLGDKTNTKLEYYLNKIIKLNLQMSVMWIWFGIIIIILGLSIDAYALHKLSINLNNFIEGYISFNPYFANTIYVPDISIKDAILNIIIANYISITAIILLMLQVLLKFHYNKNINNLYIILMLLVLIFALIFTANSYSNLYAHIDSYIKIYINLRNK